MATPPPTTNSSNDSDKRYFPRWEVNNRVVYHLEGEKNPHAGQTKDLSCAGACIVGETHIAPQQKMKISIQLAEGVKVTLNARVLWMKTENNQTHMGIAFYNTPDEVQNLILQHAFELDKDKVLKYWFKGWDGS